MKAHWSKQDFVPVHKCELTGSTEGYCAKCQADMILWNDGTLSHYKSHQVIRRHNADLARGFSIKVEDMTK